MRRSCRAASFVLAGDPLRLLAADRTAAGKDFPKGFRFAVDPGYRFTERYRLRWDPPGETAYPSTFVIGRDGRIAYAKVGRTHGDRAPVADVLASLDGRSR